MSTKVLNRAVAAAIVSTSLLATSAAACSLMPETSLPTNYELVSEADAIVVATAVGGQVENHESEEQEGRVDFKVDQLLKGSAPSALTIPGLELGRSKPSDPRELILAHPEAFRGGCIRRTFSPGGRYVLFLERDEQGELTLAIHAFTRISEDYHGDQSPWIRMLRQYLSLQSARTGAEQLTALEGLLARKLAEPASKERDQTIADIGRTLASSSPFQTTDRLVAAYELAVQGKTPRFSPAWFAASSEPLAKQVRAHLALEPGSPAATSIAYRRQLLISLVQGNHPGAAPLFDRLAATPNLPIGEFGATVRYLADHGQLRRTIELIERRGMWLLTAAPKDEAATLLSDIGDVVRGPYTADGPERWEADPYTAAAWPELALSLERYQMRFLGSAGAFRRAIAALRPADYRARPEVTVVLARTFDEPVLAWAIGVLMDPAALAAWEANKEIGKGAVDPAMALPLQVLVLASGDTRDAAIQAVFCQSHDRRYQLVATIGSFGDSVDADWLGRMAGYPGLTADEREGIARAYARSYGRDNLDEEFDPLAGFFSSTFESIGRVTRPEQAVIDAGPALECPAKK